MKEIPVTIFNITNIPFPNGIYSCAVFSQRIKAINPTTPQLESLRVLRIIKPNKIKKIT
jgi:hypothetical protein